MEINYCVTICEQLAFGIPFCGKSPQLGLFDYSQKKIQPIPNSRRCWYQPFSIGKVSSKSKTENLKCQNEVILGDFNFHNSDIYVLNFYVWFEWVAPKNFNSMDNHHKFQKRTMYLCWVCNLVCNLITQLLRGKLGVSNFMGNLITQLLE